MVAKLVSVVLFALLAEAYSAAIPRGSADKGPLVYLAAVGYGELPKDRMFYEYIQPVAVFGREAPRRFEQRQERRRRDLSTVVIPDSSGGASGGGLRYDSSGGHSASITGSNIPGLGTQVTGTGSLNLLDTDSHRLDANGYYSNTYLNSGPTIGSTGGSLDYLYNDRYGASLGMSHSDLFDTTSYSGSGRLNLYQSPSRDTSFDATAGISRSVSPYMGTSDWEPSIGLSYSKSW